MKPEIKSVHSSDIDDLATLRLMFPENHERTWQTKDSFCFPIRLLVGPKESQGEESFDVMVCSPDRLETLLGPGPLEGRHYYFLARWDFEALMAHLRPLFEIEGPDWKTIADKLSRHGLWEFEDYRPHADDAIPEE